MKSNSFSMADTMQEKRENPQLRLRSSFSLFVMASVHLLHNDFKTIQERAIVSSRRLSRENKSVSKLSGKTEISRWRRFLRSRLFCLRSFAFALVSLKVRLVVREAIEVVAIVVGDAAAAGDADKVAAVASGEEVGEDETEVFPFDDEETKLSFNDNKSTIRSATPFPCTSSFNEEYVTMCWTASDKRSLLDS